MWRYIPILPARGKWRQENCKIEASLGYIESSRPQRDETPSQKKKW
jgi:hypothetical protein